MSPRKKEPHIKDHASNSLSLESQLFLLKTGLKGMAQAAVLFDAQRQVIFANDSACSLFGVSEDDLKDIAPELWQPLWMGWEGSNGGSTAQHEARLERPDSEALDVLVEITPLTDLAGNQVGTLAALAKPNRVLETRLAEAEKAVQELSYRAALLENVRDAVVGIDKDFNITYWNKAAEALYGWTAEEAVGHDLKERLDCGLSTDQVVDVLRHIGAGEHRSGELLQYGKGGRQLYVDATAMAFRMPDGSLQGYVAAVRDISDRKGLIENLSNEKRRLQTVLETAPAAIWITDESGKIIQANPMVEEIWGAGALAVICIQEYGAYQGWWAESGEQVTADQWALARAIKNGETSTSEVIDIQRFDDQRSTILNSAAPIYDETGKLIGGV
ncbi:MAG: PAS domain S-box protein, partial [Chloroflexota bacterium]